DLPKAETDEGLRAPRLPSSGISPPPSPTRAKEGGGACRICAWRPAPRVDRPAPSWHNRSIFHSTNNPLLSMAFSRSTAISLLVAGAFFMENLDSTVIVTAIPQMAKSFGIPPVDLSLGVSAYILAMAVLIPASGWLADRFGGKTVFASAIILFTLSSMLCGISPNLPIFVLARVIQGIAGAMMVPVGRLVVLRSAKKEEIIGAIGLIVWPGLAAPVVGPPLGGFITTYFSWHWIFFLNLPLGAVALAFALRLVPQGEIEQKPFDWGGFVYTGVSCFAIMLAIQLLSLDAPP